MVTLIRLECHVQQDIMDLPTLYLGIVILKINILFIHVILNWDATRWQSASLQRSLTIQQGGDLILPKLAGGGTVNLVIDYSGNVVKSTSDERLKKNITPTESALPLMNLIITPVEFDWKKNNGHDYGFIAQDIQEHFNKSLVYNVDDGYLGFDQVKLIPYITKSMFQEIAQSVDIIKQNLI